MPKPPYDSRGVADADIGLVGSAIAHRAVGGGNNRHVRRLLTSGTGGQSHRSVSRSGGVITYQDESTDPADLELSLDVPAGSYLLSGLLEITFTIDATDLHLDVDVSPGDVAGSGGGAGTTGLRFAASGANGIVLPTASTFTLTPTISGGPAAEYVATARTLLRAIRTAGR